MENTNPNNNNNKNKETTTHIFLTIPESWNQRLQNLSKVYGLGRQEIIKQWIANNLGIYQNEGKVCGEPSTLKQKSCGSY